VRVACGLFGARADVPLAQQNDLLVQVANVWRIVCSWARLSAC
jgi:hypothetical protein